jgi:hypothetical protein
MLTLALYGISGQIHTLAALLTEKILYLTDDINNRNIVNIKSQFMSMDIRYLAMCMLHHSQTVAVFLYLFEIAPSEG